MAKITRIKASDAPKKEEKVDEPTITRKKVVVKDKKQERIKQKARKVAEKNIGATETAKNTDKKPFVLFRPFVAIGRYLRNSWHELRQVRWPNRKTTWKMVLAVIIYTAIFMIFISLLDLFFSWLFGIILSK